MKLSNLPKTTSRLKRTKRLGCGRGSGHGKTSSRGHKGGNARSGYSMPSNYSGIPLYRRLPKRGFNNANFKTMFAIVNLEALEKHFSNNFNGIVNRENLLKAGLIGSHGLPIKILGRGAITCALKIQVNKISESAKKKIEAAGGQLLEVEK